MSWEHTVYPWIYLLVVFFMRFYAFQSLFYSSQLPSSSYCRLYLNLPFSILLLILSLLEFFWLYFAWHLLYFTQEPFLSLQVDLLCISYNETDSFLIRKQSILLHLEYLLHGLLALYFAVKFILALLSFIFKAIRYQYPSTIHLFVRLLSFPLKVKMEQ